MHCVIDNKNIMVGYEKNSRLAVGVGCRVAYEVGHVFDLYVFHVQLDNLTLIGCQ